TCMQDMSDLLVCQGESAPGDGSLFARSHSGSRPVSQTIHCRAGTTSICELLLADTEFPENAAQELIAAEGPGDFAQCQLRELQLLREKLPGCSIELSATGVEVRQGTVQRIDMPLPRGENALAQVAVPGEFAKLGTKGIDACPGYRGYPDDRRRPLPQARCISAHIDLVAHDDDRDVVG